MKLVRLSRRRAAPARPSSSWVTSSELRARASLAGRSSLASCAARVSEADGDASADERLARVLDDATARFPALLTGVRLGAGRHARSRAARRARQQAPGRPRGGRWPARSASSSPISSSRSRTIRGSRIPTRCSASSVRCGACSARSGLRLATRVASAQRAAAGGERSRVGASCAAMEALAGLPLRARGAARAAPRLFAARGSGRPSRAERARSASWPRRPGCRSSGARRLRARGRAPAGRPQPGPAARGGPAPRARARRMRCACPARSAPLLVALDEVEDPQNVGAVARAAEAAGATGAAPHAAPGAALSARRSRAPAPAPSSTCRWCACRTWRGRSGARASGAAGGSGRTAAPTPILYEAAAGALDRRRRAGARQRGARAPARRHAAARPPPPHPDARAGSSP